MLFGEGHFTSGNQERRLFSERGGLHFDNALFPGGFEGQKHER